MIAYALHRETLPDELTDNASVSPQRRANRQLLTEPLSERELEVMRLIADGNSDQEIAERLVISVTTVKTHVNHILANSVSKAGHKRFRAPMRSISFNS